MANPRYNTQTTNRRGAMAKDGGKIVKTETGGKAVRPKKIKRIQIKGFGKARK